MSTKRQRGEGSSSQPAKSYDKKKFISIEAAEKFKAWENRAVIPERGLWPDPVKDGNMASMIAEKGWFVFAEQPDEAAITVVKEFYANLQANNFDGVLVRGKIVPFESTEINRFYGLPDYAITEGYAKYVSKNPDYDTIISELCRPGTTWKLREGGAMTFSHSELSRYGKAWYAFICAKLMPTRHVSDVTKERAVLLHCLVSGLKINVGDVIEKSIWRAWKGATSGGFPHPSLICALCQQAGVSWTDREEVQPPLPLIDHSLIVRYKVWDGGESHPRGLGYIMQPPPPQTEEPTTSGGMHNRLSKMQRCMDRLAQRQAAMHAYNVNFNTAMLQMFVKLNPSIGSEPCPLAATLPTYPPEDEDVDDSAEDSSDDEYDHNV